MAQQQQQQRPSPREEMLRASQAAEQSDRHWLIQTKADAQLYAIGVATGQIDPTIPLDEQRDVVIDLTGYGGRGTPAVASQPRLIVG